MQKEGYIYSRNANPTNTVLEKRLAQLEGGSGAFAVSSGNAAITTRQIRWQKPVSDEIVATNALYGGTYNLLANTFQRFGIKVRFMDGHDFDAVEAAINEKTKALFTETIGNPGLQIADLKNLSKIAHKHGIPLVVDNTFTTPYLEKPFDFGADIVVHSLTKLIGGHMEPLSAAPLSIPGDSHGITASSRNSPKKSSLNGHSFLELAKENAFIAKA